jgi:hypothetical protein
MLNQKTLLALLFIAEEKRNYWLTKKLEAVRFVPDHTGILAIISEKLIELDQATKDINREIRDLNSRVGTITNELKWLFEEEGKLQAVKLYRDQCGTSLIVSKKEVERLATENNWQQK